MTRPVTLLVVIPTRNRPEFFGRAVKSTLQQPLCEAAAVEVVVSDNSDSTAAERNRLWFDRLADGRCRLIRPPDRLGMARHWNWMLEQCLDSFEFTHCTILSDRGIFRDNSLPSLCEVLRSDTADIIAYAGGDTIIDDRRPIRIWEQPWTGRHYALRSHDLFERASHCDFPSILPKLMTSVASRRLLEEMRRDTGRVIPETLSPDYGFAFHSLLRREAISVLDTPLTVGYGLKVSNGYAYSRGWNSGSSSARDFATFARKEGRDHAGDGLTLSTPLPHVLTAANGMVHEFVEVRRLAGADRIPALDESAYLRFIAQSVQQVENPEVRRSYERMLREKGWSPPARTVRGTLNEILNIGRHMRNRLRHGPPRSFSTPEAALEYASRNWGPRVEPPAGG